MRHLGEIDWCARWIRRPGDEEKARAFAARGCALFPDFLMIVQSAGHDIPITNEEKNSFLDDPHGAEIAYHWMKRKLAGFEVE